MVWHDVDDLTEAGLPQSLLKLDVAAVPTKLIVSRPSGGTWRPCCCSILASQSAGAASSSL